MEQRSLKIYETDKTFFSKITNTLGKLLIPGKNGLNGVLISMKRNSLLKSYENYAHNENNSEKKGAYLKKYEESYTLYLETIDKNLIEGIYKKVKNATATEFEKNALSKYYMVIHLKDIDYTEYKYRKQKFLIELDNEYVKQSGKDKLVNRFEAFYIDKMDSLYKNIIKQYSIKLTDRLTDNEKIEVYDNIFSTLDEYMDSILSWKIDNDEANNLDDELKDEYKQYKKLSKNKLDQNETIAKNTLLIGMSRRLFTHSLPLAVAEQCYKKLIDDARALVIDTRVVKKKEKAYNQLINLIEEFNLKVLSTKVYWDKPQEKQDFRAFWKEYENLDKIEDEDQKQKEKEILFVTDELAKARKNENKYSKLIVFYKSKLVEFGVLKVLKSKCKSLPDGIYVKDLEQPKRAKAKSRARVRK